MFMAFDGFNQIPARMRTRRIKRFPRLPERFFGRFRWFWREVSFLELMWPPKLQYFTKKYRESE